MKEKVQVDMWKKYDNIKADWKKQQWGESVTGVIGAWFCAMISRKSEKCYISVSTNVGLAVRAPLLVSITMQSSFLIFIF